MFASVTSVALVGIDPEPVRVEVHIGGNKQSLVIVGLPDTAVREAKERVRSAVQSSGYPFPRRHVTVNLAPADLPKAGSAYDLPIALGVLAAARLVPPAAANVVALGELALDGRVRNARGGLGAGVVAAESGLRCLVDERGATEAVLAGGDVRAVGSLAQAVAVSLGEDEGLPITATPAAESPGTDLGEVRGQAQGRRALEVAAAGGHHLLFEGPPGSGKTMLASSLPGILPELTEAERLDVARAWAAAGRRHDGVTPPFRSPHHGATAAALLGGGSGVPGPGEVTLAHRGVLFLDELGEFPPHLLDGLRQPIEEGVVHVARQVRTVAFPCRVQLVAATNPCPCGFYEDRLTQCSCTPAVVRRYGRRLSGPLVDRFDMRVQTQRVRVADLMRSRSESSSAVRRRVVAARRRQEGRGVLNRDLDRAALDECPWDDAARDRLREAIDRYALTARGWDRVRRVARTIADLDDSDVVAESHVAEALDLRGRPREP